MGRKGQKGDPFKELTWADLEEWAGGTIVSRGKAYQRGGHVKELAKTGDGKLVAWVQGRARYALMVYFQDGTLESLCNCPYWTHCKHAVAAVLEYLDRIKKNREIPLVSKRDKRLQILKQLNGSSFSAVIVGRESLIEGTQDDPIKAYLKGLEKEDLVQILVDLARRYPDVRGALLDKWRLSSGSVQEVVEKIRADIRELSEEPAWVEHWSGEGDLPDYSRVRHRLSELLEKGHADEVLSLGEELLEAGNRQIEMSHDEGHTAVEIASCMEVVFQALPLSSLSPAKQMLWAVEAELKDDYGLCEGSEGFWKIDRDKQDWSTLADRLLQGLEGLGPDQEDDSFSRDYKRDRLTDWIAQALTMAGRSDEAVALCEKEALRTRSFVRLVKLLKEQGRRSEAEAWIVRGIKATQEDRPGVSRELRQLYRKILEEQKAWRIVAALRAEEFFSEPSLGAYKNLEKASKKAKVWKDVRLAAMSYLETGRLPYDEPLWPLPETGLPRLPQHRHKEFPLFVNLIDIAIEEKRPDDVLRWYEESTIRKEFPLVLSYWDDQVANALKKAYPDKAVEIWKGLAESEIAETKVKAYHEAAKYLRKIHAVMKKSGREKDWQDYLKGLRRANARKPRLIEILNGLSGKRIIDD
ncbi:MAG: SWIM zinc finger domain-containing protein [Deltaproteobacteria bacterium]|nr:SWIM zinc finger domain-containing protein [Deltaproteobacteria bacterium]MBW2136507.1 SWIM zinc finger domain-containing protein [Deltaproteobacteria bacterium]